MKNETARREIESLDYYLQNHTNDYSEESHTAMMMAIKALEQEPKTGHWMEKKHNGNMIMYHRYKCSVCDEKAKGRTGIWVQLFDYKYNYCPNCGAKMESEGEMRLTKEEKEICKEYSKRDDKGFVHCHECPLAIDKKFALCKRTITKQEWDARCKE